MQQAMRKQSGRLKWQAVLVFTSTTHLKTAKAASTHLGSLQPCHHGAPRIKVEEAPGLLDAAQRQVKLLGDAALRAASQYRTVRQRGKVISGCVTRGLHKTTMVARTEHVKASVVNFKCL